LQFLSGFYPLWFDYSRYRRGWKPSHKKFQNRISNNHWNFDFDSFEGLNMLYINDPTGEYIDVPDGSPIPNWYIPQTTTFSVTTLERKPYALIWVIIAVIAYLYVKGEK
jgi:hypothetical protein